MSKVTSLHDLLDEGSWNLERIERFLKTSPFVYANNRFHSPFLIRVVKDERCSVDLLRLLIRFGLNVNFTGGEIDPPLHAAIRHRRDVSIIKFLLKAGAKLYHSEVFQDSPLCLAVRSGASIEVIKLLLKLVGVSLNTCSHHGSAMHCSMDAEQSEDVLRLLIEAGANVNGVSRRGESPMCFALRGSPAACDIENLLKSGFSLNACTKHASPLFCATDKKSYGKLKTDVVELLLKTGARGEANKFGCTPLECALLYCESEAGAIRLLFDRQKVDSNDDGGQSATSLLQTAIQNPVQKQSVVKFLLERGAQVKNVNESGDSALHLVARRGNPSCINILLKHGAPLNSVNEDGRTPLKIAVNIRPHIEITQVLLAAGARIEENKQRHLLEMVIERQLLYERHDFFKLLAKYSLLENPDFNIRPLIRGDKDCQTFLHFVKECEHELQIMKLKHIDQDRSLCDFVREHSLHQMDDAEFDPENYRDFNFLLREVSWGSSFPIYFDVISTKVRRSSMKQKLEQLVMYAFTHCPETPTIQHKVTLDYVCLCKIAECLSDDELLRFIYAAFYNEGDNAQFIRSENVGKNNVKGRRKCERSATFLKHPKLYR